MTLSIACDARRAALCITVIDLSSDPATPVLVDGGGTGDGRRMVTADKQAPHRTALAYIDWPWGTNTCPTEAALSGLVQYDTLERLLLVF